MDLLGVKLLTMSLLGIVSLALGVLPLFFKKCCRLGKNEKGRWTDTLLSMLSCFGGGVILTTCITHMLPEVNYFLKLNIENGLFPDTGMPMAEIFVLCGFFLIYIIEELTHIFIHRFCGDTSELEAAAHEVDPMMHYDHPTTHEEHAIHVARKAKSLQASLRGFLVILALSLHAVFEGIALGLAHSKGSVWLLFFAIASHKYVISFCIGMQFVSSGLSACLTTIYVSTFALISPIGSGIGIALAESVKSEASLQNGLVTILQGLAAGTLLYVVFFEIIEKERQNNTNGILQVSFLLLGFVCMIGLEFVELESIENLGSSSNISTADVCQLTAFSPNWRLPMNFTCSKGTLKPHLGL